MDVAPWSRLGSYVVVTDRAKTYREKAKACLTLAGKTTAFPNPYTTLAAQYSDLAEVEEKRTLTERPRTAIAAFLGTNWKS
jgi:hypothetical protein